MFGFCLFVCLFGYFWFSLSVVLFPPHLPPQFVRMFISIVIFSFMLLFVFKYKFGTVDRFLDVGTDFKLQFHLTKYWVAVKRWIWYTSTFLKNVVFCLLSPLCHADKFQVVCFLSSCSKFFNTEMEFFFVPNLSWYPDLHNFFSSETFYEVIDICHCNDLNNIFVSKHTNYSKWELQHEDDYDY